MKNPPLACLPRHLRNYRIRRQSATNSVLSPLSLFQRFDTKQYCSFVHAPQLCFSYFSFSSSFTFFISPLFSFPYTAHSHLGYLICIDNRSIRFDSKKKKTRKRMEFDLICVCSFAPVIIRRSVSRVQTGWGMGAVHKEGERTHALRA